MPERVFFTVATPEQLIQELQDELYITIIDCFLEMFLTNRNLVKSVTEKKNGETIIKFNIFDDLYGYE